MPARKHKTREHKKGSRVRQYRRCCQVTVALIFILIPWLNSIRISVVHGNFLSFNLAGFPLADPLAVLQIMLKNRYLSADLMIGTLVAVGVALVLGTVFCSWVCPFGLLSDLGQTLTRSITSQKPYSKPVQTKGFKLRLGIFLIGIVGLFAFSTTPILNQMSMPAWYSRIFQFLFVQQYLSLAILFIFAVLAVEIYTGQRYWCRFVCPQSVLLTLTKLMNPKRLRVEYSKRQCVAPKKGREPCAGACNLGLDPRTLNTGIETECTNCGDCVVACSQCSGALNYTF